MRLCRYKEQLNINSAREILQYHQSNSPLVTIIGELHEHDFNCSDKNMSLLDFCRFKIEENKKCRILLEYPPNFKQQERIGSKIIRDVFTGSDTNVRKFSYGIDIRSEFIGIYNQNILYHREDYLPKDVEKLKETFINSFSIEKMKKLCRNENEEYINRIKDKFEKLKKINYVDSEVIYELKWAWAMVMDCYILSIITTEDTENTNEYIIICGNNHVKNLKKEIKLNQVTNITNRDKNKCIMLKELKKIC